MLPLLQMNKWSKSSKDDNEQQKIQPWSNDSVDVSKLFIKQRRDQKTKTNFIDKDIMDLSKAPTTCTDAKNMSFRNGTIGILLRN